MPTALIAMKISGGALRAFQFHSDSSFAGMSLTYAAMSQNIPSATTKKNASAILTMTFQSVCAPEVKSANAIIEKLHGLKKVPQV